MGFISDAHTHIRRSAIRSAKIKNIKDDTNKRSKSVVFGILAIVQEVFVALCGIGAAFLISLSSGNNSSVGDNAFIIVLGVIVGAMLVIVAIGLLVSAIINVCVQLSINKRAVGWVALILLFVCLVAVVVCALLLLDV